MAPEHAVAPPAATASGATLSATHMEPVPSLPGGAMPLTMAIAAWGAAWAAASGGR